MNKLISLSLAVIFLASCGGGKSNDKLSAKKNTLDSLKKEYSKLGDKIKSLEDEIAELDSSKKNSGTLVTLDTLKLNSFSHYVEVQGKVESEQNVGVSAQMPGSVTSILVTKGQSVSKGQILATTDASVIESSIEVVKTNLAFATTMFDKQNNLWKQGIGTEVQFLQAKSGKETLENQLATLQSQLEMTKIKSPINGTVDDIMSKIGEMVAPGFPAFRIVNLSNMKVTADVAEAYAGKIHAGDEVVLSFPDMGKEITKNITSVGRVIDPNKRSFGIEIKLSAAEQEFFNPNMVAVVKVKDYTAKEVISIPVNLVQNSDDGDFVFISGKNEKGKSIALKTKIQTGLSYGGNVEVKNGLKEGDTIITAGFEDLNDKQEISLDAK